MNEQNKKDGAIIKDGVIQIDAKSIIFTTFKNPHQLIKVLKGE